MKTLKPITNISIIVLAAIAFGWVVWIAASYFFSLNAQVNQNTASIQSIVQFLNQNTQATNEHIPSSSAPTK